MDQRTALSIAAYDDAASAYLERWRDHRPHDAIRKFAGLAGRGSRIIDVACGPALDIRLLRDAGLHVVGGDRSHEAMRVARTFFPKGSLARWDLRELPFPDDVFDGVWASAALQHLPAAEIRPALAELRRVHRTGPMFLSFREGSGDLEPFDDEPAGPVYTTTLSGDELKALLIAAGYAEVEVESRPDPFGRAGVTWLYGWGRLLA